MCEFVENVRGVLEPEFGIGLFKGNGVVGNHQYLFNCPGADDIIYQSVMKLQPPRADHVLIEDDFILREDPEA